MKYIIAAAGKGTRMGELTKNNPKVLIPVLKKPFLEYVLETLSDVDQGNIAIIAGYMSEKVEEFINQKFPKITVINQSEIASEDCYGSACAVKAAKNFVRGDNFILMNGDSLFESNDIKNLAAMPGGYSYICAAHSDEPQKYGVIKESNEFLYGIFEKPKEYISNNVNVGLYRFTSEIFDEIDNIEKSPRGEYEITDAIRLLAAKKTIKVVKLKDGWQDFGSPDDIKDVEKIIKDNEAD